jgi:tetratricopeptide (TPR) repeat protein
MRLSLILALSLLSALPSRADETTALSQGQAVKELPQPAPQLVHLERALMQKQEARDKSELPPEKYQEFVANFRAELAAVMGRIPPTPESKGLHAQILARLGEQERGQALASLEQAITEDPENPALLVAKGSILHEQKDYPAAAALAQQAWEASGRTDKRAWALLKMSEGRTAGGQTGEPAPRLRPAADFARLEWSIPENHDINPRAMGFVQQAIAARGKGEMAATMSGAQAAMNADPTSVAVQKFYGLVRDDQAKQADTLAYIRQAAESMHAGRGPEAIAWAQKAYDRSPGDDTYGILEDVRRRGAAMDAKRAPEPAKAPKGGNPALPLALFAGGSLAAYGLFQVAKSKGARASEDGLDPAPYVSPEQARRNYVNSAVYIGTPIVIFGLVYGGPIAWRAAAPVVTGAWQQLRGSAQHLATSEAGALFPGEASAAGRAAQRAPSALQGDQLRQHLRQVQKYGADGFRELEDGAIRYYGQLRNARTPGDMTGQRVVREWNPGTGTTRTWLETIDRAGNVRIVRPETGASKVHYYFNEAGEYIGSK